MKYHQLPKDKVWLKLGAMALMLMQAALSYGDPGLRALYPPDRKIYIDPSAVTVSGVSSGAYMAVQLHVAYSGTFQGVGAIAGGPYYCAENLPPSLIDTIKLRCMNGFIPPSAAPFIHEAKAAAAAGEIDNLSNLANDKVLIFNSATDQVINPGLGALSVIFYEAFVGIEGEVKGMNTIPDWLGYEIAHGFPSAMPVYDDYLNFTDLAFPCGPANSQSFWWYPNPVYRGNDPWIYDCQYPNGYWPLNPGFSFVQYLFEFLYDGDAVNEAVKPSPGSLLKLSQLDYVDDPNITTVAELKAHGIGEYAYAYVPQACFKAGHTCKLHVSLHGCQMFPEWRFTGKIGSRYAGQSLVFDDLFYNGPYNGVAEANDVAVLYPQSHNIGAQTDAGGPNPYGCWEFWAFFDQDVNNYHTRSGREMTMIHNLVQHLLSRSLIRR